jgi:DNA-binding NarL/FixJ family response regulator
MQAFRLIGQGQSSRQIAQRLHLSIKTNESRHQHIKQKLMLASGAALVRRAARWVETGQTS